MPLTRSLTLMDRPRFHVTFICTGNICRSVIAEKIFAAQIRERGLDHLVQVSSAGITAWFAHADPAALAVLAAHGYPTPNHRPTRLNSEHKCADLLVTLSRRHAHTLAAMGAPAHRVRLLRSFDPAATSLDVADPFGYHSDEFERTYAVVAAAMPGLHAFVDEQLKHAAA